MKWTGVLWSLILFVIACGPMACAETVWLDELDITRANQGWGTPQRNKSVEGRPISIADMQFARGFGTHAYSHLDIDIKGGAETFTAFVGVDDEMKGSPGSVEFKVYGDKKLLWKSGVMKAGQPAKKVDLNIKGMKSMKLIVTDGGDGINYDHADWADAKFEVTGPRPEVMSHPFAKPYILTPKPPRTPRINGAKVFGVRPGSPFLFTIPATGDRPIRFSAKELPQGLKLDEEKGCITGSVDTPGTYHVTLQATNALGSAKRELRIIVGDRICLTPPMGWNSWNCWATAVDAEKVRAAAKAMVDSGLINHGWTYINIDDAWQAERRGGPFNAIQGNEKFSDMKGLCDYVHSLGLKVGTYSTPWTTSYAGYIGGSSDSEDGSWSEPKDREEHAKSFRHGKYSFAQNDARQWAAWGIDYLKYDWNPNNVPSVKEMANALKASGRDIVLSLSNSAPFNLAAEWARLANCWRTTGDIVDTWGSMFQIGFSQDKWTEFAGPGHWNDPDMLIVGKVGWGPNLRPTRLAADEQYTHISLWCLLSSPLLLGCDLAEMDDFTLSLLTNDEVLEVNQDPLGQQAHQVIKNEYSEVWAKDMEDGSKAVGLFNLDYEEGSIDVTWTKLGIKGKHTVRDLWRQKNLGVFEDKFEAKVPGHGVVLVRIIPVPADK